MPVDPHWLAEESCLDSCLIPVDAITYITDVPK